MYKLWRNCVIRKQLTIIYQILSDMHMPKLENEYFPVLACKTLLQLNIMIIY